MEYTNSEEKDFEENETSSNVVNYYIWSNKKT